ncbi:MAG TPA: hypothetical protein VFC51_13840 [Chloroflexota bacterium]|nr:hypothetical protein [Chloroflexota bacterium]
MSARARRAVAIAAVALAGLSALVGGTAAGAATAAPGPNVTVSAPGAGPARDSDGSEQALAVRPQQHLVLGIVRGIRGQRIAIVARTGRHVAIVRPATKIWINQRPAGLDAIQVGDSVLALGRAGPRGAFIARAIRVVRRPAQTQ